MADDSDATRDGAVDSVILGQPALTESSGLAISRRKKMRLWSHNDSGGQPRIFAFNQNGHPTGQCLIRSIRAIDWEDLASFTDDGVARLLVADCGDNEGARPSVSLYLLDEPDPDVSTETRAIQTISLTYPDGPLDCEAVAVDRHRKQIILIAKTRLRPAGVYLLPLPKRSEKLEGKEIVVAKKADTLLIPMITGMDLDPDTGDIWVINYFHAFQYRCIDRNESIQSQLARLPRSFDLPRWKQIEAVAVDRSHRVWVTSEGSPAVMGRLSMPDL